MEYYAIRKPWKTPKFLEFDLNDIIMSENYDIMKAMKKLGIPVIPLK